VDEETGRVWEVEELLVLLLLLLLLSLAVVSLVVAEDVYVAMTACTLEANRCWSSV
jgi:hypothetical protein